jgi:DNA-binding CsgD family transcriptional regulator
MRPKNRYDREALLAVLRLGADPRSPRLSFRQRRVLRLWCLGCTAAQSAAVLGGTPAELSTHQRGALRGLALRHAQAAKRWLRRHRISPPGDRLSPSERKAIRQAAAGTDGSVDQQQ